MIVQKETVLVRPFVVCAILRGVTFDQQRYKSFIDLQVATLAFVVHDCYGVPCQRSLHRCTKSFLLRASPL